MRHVISLGAGVQSSTLAMMAAAGEITPMPEAAIFADTADEPKAVYDWLDWLEPQLPFPVIRVQEKAGLSPAIGTRPNGKTAYMPLPAFIQGADGNAALMNRSCTRDFKLTPIRRAARVLLGIHKKRSPKEVVLSQWIGISLDEVQRAKVSREGWVENRFPLLEKRMTRLHCIEWMTARKLPTPPRSSCIQCPFHDDAEWAAIKERPDEWEKACSIDESIRHMRSAQTKVTTGLFLHRSLVPLREVKFYPNKTIDLFDEFGKAVECEGMCGL